MHLLLVLLFSAAIQVTEPVWTDAPPAMPKGTKMAILEGSPKQAGMFTIRLRVPAGSVIAPHTHPRHERVTVLSGRLRVGFGKSIDKAGTKEFGAGAFYVNPPHDPHYLLIEEDSVLQLTCEGPWALDYVE